MAVKEVVVNLALRHDLHQFCLFPQLRQVEVQVGVPAVLAFSVPHAVQLVVTLAFHEGQVVFGVPL